MCKKIDVLNYFKNKNADLICIQDTHLTESDAFDLKNYWQGNFILHGERHNARGVAIFFGENFEYKILNTDKDTEGNMILADIEINETKFRLINMYGPNTNNEEFYTSITKNYRK